MILEMNFIKCEQETSEDKADGLIKSALLRNTPELITYYAKRSQLNQKPIHSTHFSLQSDKSAIAMRLVIIIVTVVFIQNSVQKVQFYQEDTALSVGTRFVESALLSYYEETRNIIVFAIKPSALQQFSPAVSLLLFSELDGMIKAMYEKAGTLIVILNGLSEKESLHDLEQLRSVRTKYPVMVVCDTTAACNSEVYLKSISEATNSPLFHYIVVDGEGMIQIFQRTKTAERHCGVSRLVRIAYDNLNTWPNAETFSMVMNFNKCPLRLTARPILWYAMPCEPGDGHLLCGFEGVLMRTFANKINATPITTIVESSEEIKNLVATGQADFGYGYLYNDNSQAIAYSRWYQFVKLAVNVPNTAGGFGGSLLTIALPFEFEVWIGLALSTVITLILGKLVPDFRRIRPLQQFSLIIGVSVPTQPRRLSRRIYFISIVLFGFYFSQLYLVNLTKIYSSAQPHGITTLEELEKSGLPVYGQEIGKTMLIEFGYTLIAQKYKVLSTAETLVKFAEVYNGKSSDIICAELEPEFRATWKNITDLDEAVRWYSLATVAPNSSTLMRALDKMIVAKLESRTLNRLENGLSAAGELGPRRDQEPKKLSLSDLQGIFGILVGGLLLSILLFIIELALNFFKGKSLPMRRSRICVHSNG